jgi:hypothetical protein
LPKEHNWYGAKYIYPEEHLFADPDSCLKLIQEYEQSDKLQQAQKNRRFIESRYRLEDKFNQLSRLMNKVVKENLKEAVTA